MVHLFQDNLVRIPLLAGEPLRYKVVEISCTDWIIYCIMCCCTSFAVELFLISFNFYSPHALMLISNSRSNSEVY